MRKPSRTAAHRVLVDSSAYFALLNRKDTSHQIVAALRSRLTAERWRLFTTSFVLAEAHALLLNRLNRHVATEFLVGMGGSSTTLVWVTEEDVEKACSLIVTYADKDFTLADATSFVVMERLGITTALTLDHNFIQYGFQVLPADQL